MKKEMVKLNRVKIAHSEEEEQRLISEGYTPVDPEPAVNGTDDGGQKADLSQGQKGADDGGQKADPPQAKDGNRQTADDGGKKEEKGARKK